MIAVPNWSERGWLPHHDGTNWVLLRSGKQTHVNGPEDARVQLKNWSLLSAALIAAPTDTHFRPAVEEPAVGAFIVKKFRRGFLYVAVAMALLAALGMAAYLSKPRLPLLGYSLSGVLLFALSWLQLRRSAENGVRFIAERTAFVYWLRTNPRCHRLFIAWAAFCAALAVIQVSLVALLGDVPATIRALGAYYPAICGHEYWRFITGAFLHSSASHFALNAVMLVVLGGIASSTLGRNSVGAFIAGSVIGIATTALYMALAPGGCGTDGGVAGVSGGVFALIGLMSTTAFRNRELLPQGLSIELLFAVALAFVSSTLIQSSVSNLAHVSGIAVGVAWAVLIEFDSQKPAHRAI